MGNIMPFNRLPPRCTLRRNCRRSIGNPVPHRRVFLWEINEVYLQEEFVIKVTNPILIIEFSYRNHTCVIDMVSFVLSMPYTVETVPQINQIQTRGPVLYKAQNHISPRFSSVIPFSFWFLFKFWLAKWQIPVEFYFYIDNNYIVDTYFVNLFQRYTNLFSKNFIIEDK